MNVEILELVSMDVYRDGGSLSISYKDREGTQHELVFLVDNIESDKNSEFTIYKSAVIESFIKSEYVSPITGVATPKTEIEKQEISWDLAKSILSKTEPLIKGFKSDYVWVYQSMVAIVGSKQRAIKFS
ncbi:hypothetical protein ABMA58_04075 [Oceanospirillum sp. HFRX-1_2]